MWFEQIISLQIVLTVITASPTKHRTCSYAGMCFETSVR